MNMFSFRRYLFSLTPLGLIILSVISAFIVLSIFTSASTTENKDGEINSGVTSENDDVPHILNFAILTEAIKPNRINNVSFEFTFVDKGNNLRDGALLIEVKKVYSKSVTVRIPLAESKFSKESGKARGRITLNIKNCQAVILTATLVDIAGNKSIPVKAYKSIDGITPLYDNFDGRGCHQYKTEVELADKGSLSFRLWKGNGEVEKTEKGLGRTKGNIAKLILNTKKDDFNSVDLVNPETIYYSDFQSFSTDVLVSSDCTAKSFSAGIQTHAAIIPDIGDKYWHASLVLSKNSDELTISGFWKNIKSGEYPSQSIPAKYDTWYNLRIDIQKISKKKIEISYYVNGELLLSGVPEESAILLDPSKLEWGPHRQLYIWSGAKKGKVFAFFDNVRAIYPQQIYFPNNITLYDNFDGRGGRQDDGEELAISGNLSSTLWSGKGEVVLTNNQSYNTSSSGYICKMHIPETEKITGYNIDLINPSTVDPIELISISADVLISSNSTTKNFNAGLNIHGSISRPEGDKWWNANIYLATDQWGTRIGCSWRDLESGENMIHNTPAILDRWFNLRIDINKTEKGELRLSFYADDILIFSGIPRESSEILNPNFIGSGLRRSLTIYKNEIKGNAIAFFDNVKAIYGKRIPNDTPVLDDFDGNGNYFLGRGEIVPSENYITNHEGHGNVFRFYRDSPGETRQYFNYMTWGKYKSFSADFLISSETTTTKGSLALDNHGAVPETPPGVSFYIQMIIKIENDSPYFVGFYRNLNTMMSKWHRIQDLQKDKWYNLRVDITKLSDFDLRVEYFVDNFRKSSDILSDSGILLNPSNLLDPSGEATGGSRKLLISLESDGKIVIYMDNVRAIK